MSFEEKKQGSITLMMQVGHKVSARQEKDLAQRSNENSCLSPQWERVRDEFRCLLVQSAGQIPAAGAFFC